MAGVVFLGDDFTGASDSLATYARHGWRTRLVMDPAAGTHGLDALGLPTDLRALSPDRARAEIARLWPVIAQADPRILHFKVCSTFDSAPGVGSIGAAAQDLMDRFKPDIVAVIGGQPGLGRHCVFGHLFARGPDGATHRIDRHPVMAQHPVTPMTESDLRLHLAAQGLALHGVPVAALHDRASVHAALRAGPVLFDVFQQDDLRAIASVLGDLGGRQLLIGASSVADLLAGAAARPATPDTAPPPPLGATLLFAGSRSANTAAQVKAFDGPRIALTRQSLTAPEQISQAASRLADGPLLIHLDPGADYGLIPDHLADACADFVADVADRAPVSRLMLAGGDTSSRIIDRLGFAALDYESDLDTGVALCIGRHATPGRDAMRIALKGGQMGATDLFNRFAA